MDGILLKRLMGEHQITIVDPTLTVEGAPGDVSLSPLLTTSAFALSAPAAEIHIATSWRALSEDGQVTVWESLENTSARTGIVVSSGKLDPDTTYQFQVKHHGYLYGASEWVSVTATTTAIYVEAPTILTPADQAVDVSVIPEITASEFSVEGSTDSHKDSDWQFALDAGFSNIEYQSMADSVNLESITVPLGSKLSSGQTIYVRVRYRGDTYPAGAWSDTIEFTTDYVRQPTITAPAQDATDVLVSILLEGSAFDAHDDVHAKSDWQAATDAGFSNVFWSSYNNETDLEEIQALLPPDTLVYVRVRYHGEILGPSEWAPGVSFTTADVYVETPTITVEGHPDYVPEQPTLTTSAFSVHNATGEHHSTDWRAIRVSDSEVVWESPENETDKLEIVMPAGILEESTGYQFQARHRCTTYGVSDWATTTATTVDEFSPMAGILSGPGPQTGEYDEDTDTGYYGYVGSGNEPEYDDEETYSAGNIVKDANGEIFYSRTDNNLGNALPAAGEENTNWRWIGNGVLTTGAAVASAVSLTSGNTHELDSGWLKFYVGPDADCNHFARHGQTAEAYVCFIAYKTFRNSLSWQNIYSAGAMFGTGDNGPHNGGATNTTQDGEISVNDIDYIIRCPLGATNMDNTGLTSADIECADEVGFESEWNSLMHRAQEDIPDCDDPNIGMPGGWETTRHGGSQNGDTNWAAFKHGDITVGNHTFCQERGVGSDRCTTRGFSGIAGMSINLSFDDSLSSRRWRPVLQLKGPTPE